MDKPKCPYCGEEMIAQRESTGMVRGMDFMVCHKCFSRSPAIHTVDGNWDGKQACAYAAAMRRWQEPSRPLTLDEATGSDDPCVFLETKNNEPIWACNCVISPNLKGVNISFIGDRGRTLVAIFDYGKMWRCWLRRPTDEERKVVRWEDD